MSLNFRTYIGRASLPLATTAFALISSLNSSIATAATTGNTTATANIEAALKKIAPQELASKLTISVSPDHAEIFPGHATTCTELDTAATPTTPPDDDPNLRRPTSPALPLADRAPVLGALRFPGFILDYTGTEKIRITYALVKVTLPDQEYEFSINDTELANLLGLTPYDLVLDGPTHIVSNDPHDMNRQDPSPYAPCGLVVNEIPLTTPGLGFKAPVQVKMTAYPVDNSSGNQFEFEVTATGDAEYVP